MSSAWPSYQDSLIPKFAGNRATYPVVHQEYSILVSADGDILDVQGSHRNRSIRWYDMDGCADFVRGRYPNAVIQAGINDSGDNVLGGIFYGLKMFVNRGCVISETVYFKG